MKINAHFTARTWTGRSLHGSPEPGWRNDGADGPSRPLSEPARSTRPCRWANLCAVGSPDAVATVILPVGGGIGPVVPTPTRVPQPGLPQPARSPFTHVFPCVSRVIVVNSDY